MLQRQAKTLRKGQIAAALDHIARTRHPARNRVIFLLSVRAGLRAKEIASLEWGMVTDADGRVGQVIRLQDKAAKGSSGGVVPMAADLRRALDGLRQISPNPFGTAKLV